MSETFRISASAHVPAPAGTTYAIIADYHAGHPRIVPPRAFTNIEVLEGGVGTGTRIRVTMRILRTTQRYEALITEPVPGEVLAERDVTRGGLTTFTVTRNGDGCDVTITSDFPSRAGPFGALERWAMRRLLLPLYREELQRLAKVAAEN